MMRRKAMLTALVVACSMAVGCGETDTTGAYGEKTDPSSESKQGDRWAFDFEEWQYDRIEGSSLLALKSGGGYQIRLSRGRPVGAEGEVDANVTLREEDGQWEGHVLTFTVRERYSCSSSEIGMPPVEVSVESTEPLKVELAGQLSCTPKDSGTVSEVGGMKVRKGAEKETVDFTSEISEEE